MPWWAILIILAIFFPSIICPLLIGGASLLFLVLPILIGAIILPLPIKDSGTVRYNSIPWVTATLIFVNVMLFFLWQGGDFFGQYFANSQFEAQQAYYGDFVRTWTYGFRTSFIIDGVGIGAWSTFTSIFMHASLEHLTGNMIYLWAFGRRVEDACGSLRFLLFYLIAGMVANIASAFFIHPLFLPIPGYENVAFDIPGIGASGAIAGIMGAYLLLFPGARVQSLWGLGIVARGLIWLPIRLFGGEMGWKWTLGIPAWMLLIFFAVTNILPSLAVIQGESELVGTNTIAHMAGFLAALLIFMFVRKDLLLRYIKGRRL